MKQTDLSKQHKELIRYGKVIKDISDNCNGKPIRETVFLYNSSEYLVKMECGKVDYIINLSEDIVKDYSCAN